MADQPDECSINPLTGQPRMARNFVQDDGTVPVHCTAGDCPAEPLIPRCDCLALGSFNVYVKAIYFGDDDGSATDGIDNDGNGVVDDAGEGLSCGDTIFEVEKSDAGQFTLTNTPYIFKLNPRQSVDQNVAPFSVLKIFGGNFGVYQEDGSVRIGTKADFLNPTLGLGKEMTRIVLWSDSLIKVRVQVPDSLRGKTRYVWVEKGGEKTTELMKLHILAP